MVCQTHKNGKISFNFSSIFNTFDVVNTHALWKIQSKIAENAGFYP
jgi:hypothetical protein